jgi:ABC-2 type transport system permease protein
MRPEFVVAVKEFKDYLTSKRFLLIFAVLVLMSIAAIISGMGTYNEQIAAYNQNLQQASGAARAFQPEMPSMLLVFESFGTSFITVGWLLAIAIGFDLISKEKETGSLKLLLARPTYRDSIINGKILGATSILIISLLATFLIAIALLLFGGIVPTGDDISRLAVFFLMIVLFSITFLAIAIAASAIAKNSTIAILLAIGFVVFSLLLPNFMGSIADIALGQAPTMLIPATSGNGTVSSNNVVIGYAGPGGRNSTVQMQINPEYTSYENTRSQIIGAADLISPTSDLTSIARTILGGQQSTVSGSGLFEFRDRGMSSPSLGSTLPAILPQVLALVVMTIAGFAIAYAKFIRMDVR